MLLTINGPLQHFWQWDADRTLIVHEETCSEVHFSNGTEECAPVCDVYEHSGLRLVNVPNIFLQEDRPLVAYLYRKGSDGQLTRCQQVFHILSRPKPDDYVYTETEVKRWEALETRVQVLEQAAATFEESVMDVLLALQIAPVVSEDDGTILTDDNGVILLNM